MLQESSIRTGSFPCLSKAHGSKTLPRLSRPTQNQLGKPCRCANSASWGSRAESFLPSRSGRAAQRLSLHRIGFGLFLITAFSVGLAAVLVMVGLTMVYTKRLMAARVQAGSAALRYLPFLSSAFMVMLGVGITVSAISSVQFRHGLISTDKLVPFVTVVLLGLFLGIRHSTDPDHVVAVSTIVSRQGSIRSSAAIGLLMGIRTHSDHFLRRVRNYYFRRCDPAPAWTVHGVLCCPDADPAGCAESNWRDELDHELVYAEAPV